MKRFFGFGSKDEGHHESEMVVKLEAPTKYMVYVESELPDGTPIDLPFYVDAAFLVQFTAVLAINASVYRVEPLDGEPLDVPDNN